MKKQTIKKYICVLLVMMLSLLFACTTTESFIAVSDVSFSQDSITLKIGETYQLEVDVLPLDATDQTLEFTTTSSVISVSSSGLLEALSVGTGTVLVSTSNELTDEIKVHVIDDTQVPVSNIILSISTLQLEKNDTYQITATIIPNDATDKSLTYESSDTSVASVSETGFVTALNTGNAVITIESANGVKTTLNVIVTEPQLAIYSDTLGHSIHGQSHTAGLDLTHLNDENPYLVTSNTDEQRIYFTEFDRSNYVVSVKIKSNNSSTATIPKAGIIVGQNQDGVAAVAIDFKTRIEVYAGYRTNTGQWDWLEPGGNSNAPVAVSPLIDLSVGTTLSVVRMGSMFYTFIEDTYIFKREIPSLGIDESVGLMSEGTSAVFSDYYVTDDVAIIDDMMANITQKTGQSALTIGDSLFDYYDDAINDTIQSFIYGSGYTHFYKDNIGGSKITPEVNLSGRSIVNHIDVGTYEAFDDLDLIIIQRGTNDVANWRNNNVIKGEIGDGNKNTTFGAIAYIMDYFRTKHPNARIIWSTIIYRGDKDFEADHKAYNDALLEIAPTYDVEVFDLRTAIGINQTNFTTYLSSDRLHLSAAGELQMKNAWLEYLDDVLPENRVHITAPKTNFIIDLAAENSVELLFDVTGTPIPEVILTPNTESGFTIDLENPYLITFDTVGQYDFEMYAHNTFDADQVVFYVTVVDTSSTVEIVWIEDNFDTGIQYDFETTTGASNVAIENNTLVYSVGSAGGSAFSDYLFDNILDGVVITEMSFAYDGSGSSSFMNLIYMYSSNINLTGIGGSIAYSFAVGGRNDQADGVAHLRVNRTNNVSGSDAITHNGDLIYINKNQTYTIRIVTNYTNKTNHLYFKGGDFNDGSAFEFIGTFSFRNEATLTRILRTGSDKANSIGYIESIKVYTNS